MPSFSNFSTILPDPSNNWGDAGEENATTGLVGPGFSAIKESSSSPIMTGKFSSQKRDKTSAYFHKWVFSISYNSLLRDQMDAIFTFLLHKNETLEPFFVSIPKYSGQITTDKIADVTTDEGKSTILITSTGASVGEVFKIQGKTKMYKIVRVETSSNYSTSLPAVAGGKERLHITPPAQEDIIATDTLIFTSPLFRVQQTGKISNSLKSTNLYSFSLSLEEV